jgi:Fe-S oxidoreductase
VYSKHLHIALAPLNVLFSRRPNALGALKPMRGNGKVLDFEEADPDPDVIWSCTNCGACVEECPVDIEHIDHIDGMRRYQVLIESAFQSRPRHAEEPGEQGRPVGQLTQETARPE